METILKVIKDRDYDRYVFKTYKNYELIGLNFQQGIDKVMYDFSAPDKDLWAIYEEVALKLNDQNENDKIVESIERYLNKYLLPNKEYVLAMDQTKLIQDALKHYLTMFEKFNAEPTQDEAYKMFDLQQLSAMLNYKVKVELTQSEEYAFAFTEGIDLPMYNKN